ncbi:MAG: RluA family pseudouridine synthase [Candidatus Hydrogenedentes bacterium]|jgi:23S rRNA pseudouridine1911/1915/1917 synthase|nr:RluA family pseudouridine synthase [Candidatus Hydrogenedentota bacterium]
MSDILDLTVETAEAGLRLDVFLAEMVEDASRSFLQKRIKEGSVRIDGEVCTKPSRPVLEGEQIVVELPDPVPTEPVPENLPLEILYEDASVVVINKAAGMVVHPAPGHEKGTLVNALLYHCKGYEQSGGDLKRPGIVHRLDRYTSGVMVAAKTVQAYHYLAKQAADHSFDRRYIALVRGAFKVVRGTIHASVGRSLVDGSRMTVTGVKAKEATTHFEILESFGAASLVRLRLETGRTHQIRVHMRFSGHPILGDPVYGETRYSALNVSPACLAALAKLKGQALHAQLLGFEHPLTKERMHFSSEAPKHFQDVLQALRHVEQS